MDITVLPPDMNASMGNFAPDGEAIHFGLDVTQNMGGPVVDTIVETRAEKGRFASFQDFLDKVPQMMRNKRTIQFLVRAGAFDSMGYTRRALLARYDEAVDTIIDAKRNEAIGQFDLFGTLGEDKNTGSRLTINIPDLPGFNRKTKLVVEREMLGPYVSDHPLRGVGTVLARHQDYETTQVVGSDGTMADRIVKIAGLVPGVTMKATKQDNAWAVATTEDMLGSVDIFFFPHSYGSIQTYLAQNIIVQIKGKMNVCGEDITIHGQPMTLLGLSDGTDLPLGLRLPAARCTPELLTGLRDILESHPGGSPVRLHLTEPGCTAVIELDPKLRAERTSAFFSRIKAAAGAGGVVTSS